MIRDDEIGRIVAVDTAQITIELNKDLKALIRSTYEGNYEIGCINSYIIVPVGNNRLVAIITRVFLTEDSELKTDKTLITLPSTRRLMKATLIGTIEDDKFSQGISVFPILDNPVLITSKKDLDIIFSNNPKSGDNEDPGFCIPIGKSVIFPDYDIKINPDVFFGKHAAIIGSTGSGKSCSIATIIQSILEQDDVKRTNIVILDTNGEYRSAFKIQDENGNWIDALVGRKSLYIPSDNNSSDRLVIPYWFMNADDFTRLFRAQPGVQRPVLIKALDSARNSSSNLSSCFIVREKIISELNNILSESKSRNYHAPKNIVQMCKGLAKWIGLKDIKETFEQLKKHYKELENLSKSDFLKNISDILNFKEEEKYCDIINLDKEKALSDIFLPVLSELLYPPPTKLNEKISLCNADTPSYFDKQKFRYQYIPDSITNIEFGSNKARENCSTMLLRMNRLFEDNRFDFLFGSNSENWGKIENSLATFFRDILGLASSDSKITSSNDDAVDISIPFYNRQRKGAERSNVVIVDLSLLSSEVLENVTALLGRLILELLQRLSNKELSGINRGEFPVVLVLEEAQNYIPEGKKTEEESISKQVFEKIAREGRKYGLSLVIASQRPSELSKTVLSQCNSFIVHRLQNPEDLRYFKEIVPGIYNQFIEQLPSLAPRTALVLGECVQAPAIVNMRKANPMPSSKNPKFYHYWTSSKVNEPNVEKVCAKWENNNVEDLKDGG